MFLAHRPRTSSGGPSNRRRAAPSLGREPVRPLPAELRPEHRAVRLQPVVERRDDARAAALVFLVREGDGVVLAIGLAACARTPSRGRGAGRRSGGCRRPTGPSAPRPPSPIPPAPSPRRRREAMPKALKPAPTYMLAHSGARPRMKLPSGVKLSGAVDHLLDAASASAGTRAMACSMCCSKWSQSSSNSRNSQSFGHVARGPGLRVGLVAAHDQTADLLLEIGAPVGVAQRGRVGRQARRSSR